MKPPQCVCRKCVCVHASLQLCKVGIVCVTLACCSRRNTVPPFLFFRKRCVGAYVPAAAHCYLSSRRKQLQFLLDVFLCLFGFCSISMKAKEEKTDINLWVRVCVVWLNVPVYVHSSYMWWYGGLVRVDYP